MPSQEKHDEKNEHMTRRTGRRPLKREKQPFVWAYERSGHGVRVEEVKRDVETRLSREGVLEHLQMLKPCAYNRSEEVIEVPSQRASGRLFTFWATASRDGGLGQGERGKQPGEGMKKKEVRLPTV